MSARGAEEDRLAQILEAASAEEAARRERNRQDWLEWHRVDYPTRGVMLFGRCKGQPLATVARDEGYCKWFMRSTYGQENPGLAQDIAAARARLAAGPAPPVCRLDGGCELYELVAWGERDSRPP